MRRMSNATESERLLDYSLSVQRSRTPETTPVIEDYL
jgi:hypothetical protein